MPEPAREREGVVLARGALVSALGVLAGSLRSLFTLLVARVLGQAALGLYSTAFAVLDLVSKVGTFGLDHGVAVLVARAEARGQRARTRALLARGVAAGVLLSVLLAVLGAALAPLLVARGGRPPELGQSLAWMLLALPAVAAYRIASGASRGLRLLRHDILSHGIAEGLVMLAAFGLALLLAPRERVPAIAVLAGTLAAGIVAWGLARRATAGPDPGPAEQGAGRELLRFSAPVMAYGLLNILSMRMDLLALGLFAGRVPGVTFASVGLYAVAWEIAGLLRRVRTVTEPIFGPVVASAATRDGLGAAAPAVSQLGRWVVAAALPALAVVWLAGGSILALYGPQFRAASVWLAVLALAHAINSFAGLAETVVLVQRPLLNLVNSTVATALQLLGVLLLVPRLGPLGAALATLAAYAVQALLRYLELRFVFGFAWPLTSLWRPVVAAVVAVLPALAARALVAGVAGELSALAVFLLLHLLAWRLIGLDPTDRETLRALVARSPAATPGPV